MATMADVARRAGVSVSTVSHVLNKTRKVSPETIRAVEGAMAEVGFAPNVLARGLVGASTKTIGVALSAITNIYFGEVVLGIQAECARNGFILFLTDTGDDPDHQFEVIRELHQRRVDGMILAPVPDPGRRALKYMEAHKIQAVFVDRRAATAHFDQVIIENTKAMKELVSHLVGHGHRRIGLVSGLHGLSTTIERIEGYRAGLAEAGLLYDDSLVESGESDIETANQAVQRLLGATRPPTAIIAANNKMTIGAMRALRSANRRVPQDVALVGFDDFEWADSFEPRLTVIAQPCEEMGMRAARLLLDRLKKPDKRPRTIRLQPVLRIRNSCGCA